VRAGIRARGSSPVDYADEPSNWTPLTRTSDDNHNPLNTRLNLHNENGKLKVERKQKVETQESASIPKAESRNPMQATEQQHRPIVVTVASAKGGSMKSTLCAALAVQAVATGAKVHLLDWEPQGSLTYWWTVRGQPDNPGLIAGIDRTPAEAARRSDADWLFCDTAPAMLEQVEQAIGAADYVLIPLLASAIDLLSDSWVISVIPLKRSACPEAIAPPMKLADTSPKFSCRKELSPRSQNLVKTLMFRGGPSCVQDRLA
jgi:hypothetical protein